MGLGFKYGIIAETGNNIQTNGLIFYVDPAYKKSYITGSLPPSTFNLASGSLTPTGSLKNHPEFEGFPTASWVMDGVDDYIDCATGGDICNFSSASAFSVSAWINYFIDTDPHASVLQIISRGALNGGWQFCLDSNLKIKLLLLSFPPIPMGERGAISSVLSGESWRHVVGTWNGSTGGIYINSIKDTTQISEETINEITGSYNLQIGGLSNGSQQASGSLGPVMVYNRELSAADVLQNYNAQKGRFGY